jgi:hypothetical protein
MPFIVAAVLAAVLSVGLSAEEPDVACPSLPANISVAGVYRARIEELFSRSPTLLNQCRQIAAADRVVVRVSVARPQSCCRATATIRRSRDGQLCAEIALPVSPDFAELLAHELEHVVEQIEGVDLAALASSGQGGVYRVTNARFETVRARDAGRAAAREVIGFVPEGRQQVQVMVPDR